jgi:hypothetical protein
MVKKASSVISSFSKPWIIILVLESNFIPVVVGGLTTETLSHASLRTSSAGLVQITSPVAGIIQIVDSLPQRLHGRGYMSRAALAAPLSLEG